MHDFFIILCFCTLYSSWSYSHCTLRAEAGAVEAYYKCRPAPDLLIQDLHFKKFLRWLSTLHFEKHQSTGWFPPDFIRDTKNKSVQLRTFLDTKLSPCQKCLFKFGGRKSFSLADSNNYNINLNFLFRLTTRKLINSFYSAMSSVLVFLF